MRRKSIFLYHVLIIGVISTNSDPSEAAIARKLENALRQIETDADTANMVNKCPHAEHSGDETKIPACHSLPSGNIGDITARRSSPYRSNKAEKESNSAIFIEKLTSAKPVLNKSSDGKIRRGLDKDAASREGKISGERYRVEHVSDLEKRSGLGVDPPPAVVTNTSSEMNKRSRRLSPASGLKPNNMKGGALSTEQSITATSLSDNDRLSKDSSSDIDSKASYEGMDRLRLNASKFRGINQNEKELTTRDSSALSTVKESSLHPTVVYDLDSMTAPKYVADSGNNSEISRKRTSEELTNTTISYLQPPWEPTPGADDANSQKSFNFTTDSTTSVSRITVWTPPDAAQNISSPEDSKYGKVKYSNIESKMAKVTKVLSNFIGNLKSRLDYKVTTSDYLEEPILTTSVSSDVQTYLVDVYSTFITPEGVNFTNDSVVFGNKSSGSKVLQDMPWPVKKEAVVEGDVIIGGLMMVHEREDTITCGPIMPQGGIQALEAMLYTLDQINFMIKPFLLNITLGAHILDDCDKDTYGLEMAVDFIKALNPLAVFNQQLEGKVAPFSSTYLYTNAYPFGFDPPGSYG